MKYTKMLLFYSLFILWSCVEKSSQTAEVFQYHNTFSKHEYSRDSSFFVDKIRRLIKSHEAPYYPKTYDDETQIYIDTILYNSTKEKIVFFVVTKNSNTKLLITDNPNNYHYDGRCFFGVKYPKKPFHWDVYWLRIFNINQYKSYKSASTRIREMYFKELATIQNQQGKSIFKFNLDDIRFWSGPVWELNEINQKEIYEGENH